MCSLIYSDSSAKLMLPGGIINSRIVKDIEIDTGSTPVGGDGNLHAFEYVGAQGA